MSSFVAFLGYLKDSTKRDGAIFSFYDIKILYFKTRASYPDKVLQYGDIPSIIMYGSFTCFNFNFINTHFILR